MKWIATAIITPLGVALVGGTVLLLLEHKVIAPDASRQEKVEAATHDAATEPKSMPSARSRESLTQASVEACPVPKFIDLAALEGALRDASGVSYTTSRDAAYQRVVDAALHERHYGLAFKAAKLISYTTTRDAELGRVVDAAIRLGQYDCASVAASAISYTTTRDAAHSSILGARLSPGSE